MRIWRPRGEGKTVIAIGPGLGREPDIAELVHGIAENFEQSDGARCRRAHGHADTDTADRLRVLTPHPGEMARLTGKSTADVQADRIGMAREYAVRERRSRWC